MQHFKIENQDSANSTFFKWKKILILTAALFFGAFFNSSQAQVSLTFSKGYLGTQKSAVQNTSGVLSFSTLGISRVSFSQSYEGTFGGTQGNDLAGTIKLYLTSGQVITLNGALNFREGANPTNVFGLIFDPGESASITYGSSLTYNITGGSVTNVSTSLGLRSYLSSIVFTDGVDRGGNAATSSIISLMNEELANTPQPSTITLSSNSVTEGQNLVYNVTLSSPTTSGNPQVYTFLRSGTSSSTIDYNSAFTFSNGVVNNGDGTITVPGGVSSFSITVNTIDDVSIESTETLILNIGSKSATGNILDNDAIPVITTSGSVKTFTSCSGCTVTPKSFTVSGVELSTNNLVVTAPTGVQVSTNSNTGFATSINIAPTAGTVTTTTVYAKLTSNATSVASGVISVTSTGAAAKTLTVTTNTDNALNFDGTNDYIGLPTTVAAAYNNAAVTIEAWIKTTDVNGINEIISWGSTLASNNVVEFRTSYGKLQFILNNGSGKFYGLESTNAVNTGKWVHVAVVKSGTDIVLYVNGQVASGAPVANSDATSSPSLNTANIGVLRYRFTDGTYGTPDSYFSGGIDQLRVWNTAKSSTDIAANMYVEMAGNETGLVASYDFNQGVANGSNSITTLTDNSTNAYNGTLTNFPTTMSGSASNFVAGFIPEITAAGNATILTSGNTLQLSNGLTGGVWASSNTSLATVNSATGMVTAIASGTVSISYTICDKTISYTLTLVTPTITTTGTLKTFTSCSGCSITAQSFTVAGTNLGANVTVTAPTGFLMSTTATGTYVTSLTYTPTSGTLATTSVFAKLTNSATTASSGNFTITSTGATSKTITATVNTDNSMHFDGTDAINIGQPLSTGSSYTMEAWIKHAGNPDANIISSFNNAFFISGNILYAGVGGSYSIVTSPGTIPLNKWTHVAVSFDDPANTMRLYINGVQVSINTNVTQSFTLSGLEPLYIGSHTFSDFSPVSFFNGNIDEVRIWNTVRSVTDIQNYMFTELSGNDESNLKAYYTFNQGVVGGTNTSITNLIDNSTSAYASASLSSFTKTGSTSNFVVGFVPDITAAGNATTLLAGGTLALSNGLVGGVWSSSNSNVATINASTGLITGVAGGNATMSYTICGKVVTYNATVLVPTLTTGTLKTFTSCSGCTIPAQSFMVAGTNLGSNVIITAPTGLELAGTSTGTYSTTISLTPSAGTLASTYVFARLINSATTATNGNFTVASTGAASKTLTATVNTDNALSFDGSNDILTTASNITSLNITGDITVETWIRLNQMPIDYVRLIGKGSPDERTYGLWLDRNGSILWQQYTPSINNLQTNNSIIPVGKWCHIAVSRTGSNVKIYINGIEVISSSLFSGTSNSSTAALEIGGASSIHALLNGSMDEVRIWNVGRTSNQIADNYLSELIGNGNANETGLVAYYNFNQGIAGGSNSSISAIVDRTSNGISGTLTNFAKTGSTSNFVAGVIPEITGETILNKALTTTYTNALTGGTWSSSSTNIASVNATTGVVTGVAAGNATITYTICEKTVSKLVTVVVPTITTTGTLNTFSTCLGTASAAQTFTVSAQYLTANLGLTAPTGYEVSTDGSTYSSTLSIAPSSGTVSARLIYVRLAASSVNGQSGNISITSTDVVTKNVATGVASVTRTVAASVTISSNATNNSICANANVLFTATPTNGGNAPTYQWKLNGTNITGANSATYSTTSLTNNDVVTVLMGSSLTSCVTGTPANSNSITTTVTAIPATPGVISGASTICMNSNQVYSIAAVPGATSYSWVVTGDLIATASTTNVLNITASNNAGSGTIKVLATNTCGSSVYSNVFSVTVSNQPAPTASFTVSGNTVCLTNAGVTFTSTSTPNATTSSPINTYAWSFGDGTTASTGTSSNTYTMSGSFDAVLTIEDANQCTSSVSSRIIVDPLSVAGSASAASTTICEGSSTILTLTGNTGTIQWQSSTDGISFNNITGATTATYNTGNLTATAYYQAVVTSGVCSSATSGVVTVTVSPTPSITISQVANVYATATSFNIIYNNAIGTPDAYSISAVGPNALPNFNTISNYGLIGSPITVAIPASAVGTYNFNLTLANGVLGCSSSALPFTLTVAVAPPANLSYTTPNVYTVGGGSIAPLNPSSTGGPITQYTIGPSLPAGLTIDPTTGIISGTPSAVSSQTSYTVTGTNASGTVTATVVITVNVAPPASLSYNTPNIYTTGTTITPLNPSSTGGPITQYTIGPSLPAGLTIDPTTGIISGTPSAVSSQTSYTVTGTNASGTVTATVVITVNSSVVPQPQGSLNAVDFGLLAADTVKLRLTTSNGTAPFTLILSNSINSIKDTLTNLTPVNNVIEFLQKRLDTTKVFTLFKLIDANNNIRTSGFTKDTTIVRLLKPQIVLTLKADPAIKQPDNSFKTRLLMKIKNVGQLNLRNVQVNANLSTVFPAGLNYTLDSVRVLAGNLVLNPNYTGAGTATAPSNTNSSTSTSLNGGKSSFAVLDGNYLFNTAISLNQSEEGEVAYYVSIGATSQNIVLKLQFETAGDGVLVRSDGSTSAQQTNSSSDDGTNISQHPDITFDGVPMPTYVPLFPNEKIGASLNVGSATPVTGGFQYHFTAKVKNYGNVNLDSIRIEYNFNELYPAPDQASLVGTPTITRGNIVYNTNSYDGYNDVFLYKYGGDLQVGDSATYEYDLKITTNRAAYTWPSYFVAYGRSVNSGVFVNDTSMAGTNPDPNNDNDPIEKFLTGVTINYERPAPPTVENKTYLYGTITPPTLRSLVQSTPSGTIPVWCDLKTAACSIIAPPMPTEIGRYVFALRSYDTTTLLYSEVLVYDTVIIKPPVPIVLNKKYIIGVSSNPLNISKQVTGMTGSTLKYFKNAGLLNTIPTLGLVPGLTRYTTSQTVNDIESDTVGFTVTMLDPKTMLHLQKIAEEPKLQTNSTFNITYTFLVNNRTDESMSNVLVVDNLQNTFPQPTAFTKVSLTSTGGLTVNNGFNGISDINLLSGSSSLAAFVMDTIRLTINLQPKGYTGTVNNVAIITATTPYGVVNMNSSSKSFASETSKSPTPSVIPDLSIDIPEAFSPNRDGVNDRFVILKPFGTTLDLEVYNRWGNVVYANSNYNNEWDGRGTNNVIGQELMDGGYYYTLKAKSVNGNVQIFKGFVLIQR